MSSGPSKVIVLDPDPRAGRQVQLGFEREGIATVAPAIPDDPGKLDWDGEPAGIVLVGGKDAQAVALVRRAKQLLKAKGADVPIVCTGAGVRRELEAAGADEVLARPAFLRDVVTVARVLRDVPSGQRDHLVGSLAETTGVLTLVRALSTLGRSAVLTLIRGLRRGEVRFYRGEVTSAQVGLIHGQAALHQLLLWTDARFDFAHEDIVRRQQIPMSAEELFADAEQFLEGVREHAGQLSPATVLEQDVMRIQSLGKQIPTEVHGVLRMFDGHRVLADVLEDSPYRVFETLRVTQKAVEVGLLKLLDSQRPKATWRAVLAIEEWLVGTETRDSVVERTAALDSGPTSSSSTRKKGKGKRRSKKMKAVAPPEPRDNIDWGALVPRVIGAEVGPLSGVVPAQETHGEVELPTRGAPREGLEALMDTDKRQRIFPTDIGLEPKVVIDSGETDDWEKVEWEAKQKALAEEKAAAEKARVQAEQQAKADAYVLGEAAAKMKAEAAKPADTEPGKRKKKKDSEPVIATADTPPAGFAAVRDEDAKPEAVEAKRERETARLRALAEKPKTAPDATPKVIIEKGSAPVVVDRATASLVAVPTQSAAKADPAAAVIAAVDEVSAPRQRKPSGTDANDLVRGLVAEAVPRSEATPSNGSGEPAKAAIAATTTSPAPVHAPAQPDSDAKSKQATTEVANVETAKVEPARSEPLEPAKLAEAAMPELTKTPEPAKSEPARMAEPAKLEPAKLEPAKPAPAEPAPAIAELAPKPAPAITEPAPATAKSASDVTAPAIAEASKQPALHIDAAHVLSARHDVAATGPTPKVTLDSPSDANTKPIRAVDDAVTTPFLKPTLEDVSVGEPILLKESPATSISVTDVVTVKGKGDTAIVTAKPAVMISESPETSLIASTAPALTVSSADAKKLADGTPIAAEDEPSDGVVRSMIASADTARERLRARPPTPEHDGPVIKETTGEIRPRVKRETIEPSVSEPSILVADLAAAHEAIAAVSKPASPPPADAASASRELAVSDVRRDAVAFSEEEEAFFKKADKSVPVSRVELDTFEDLDEGYQPQGFWDKVFGRKKKD